MALYERPNSIVPVCVEWVGNVNEWNKINFYVCDHAIHNSVRMFTLNSTHGIEFKVFSSLYEAGYIFSFQSEMHLVVLKHVLTFFIIIYKH